MVHLKSIRLETAAGEPDRFPFNLPVVQKTKKLEFASPVTFFVGENAAGKSTLLEALAAGIGSVTVGGHDVTNDPTLEPARSLARCIRFAWTKKINRGFFLRAEDFFQFTRRLQTMKDEFRDLRRSYDQERDSYGLRLAKGMVAGQIAALTGRYGENLDANSHGESFFKLFQARLVPDGLYLLDEPETPFSPKRQMALLVLLHDMVQKNCQFIIATHSPILMAYPGACILNFDELPVRPTPYDQLEHVNLVRSFLNNPEKMLRMLLREPE